ncbi:MAG: hypothetical protein K5929_03885 [Lachnospiraceae bacterium]|nr:hypothetical protein [Lachnospiraceae bacterium]
MTELFLYAVMILFGFVLIVGIPFNIIKSKGTNKKIVIIGDIVLFVFGVAVLIISLLYRSTISKNTGDSKLVQYSFWGSMTYTGAENGYYTLNISALMGGWQIAVPMDDIELTASVKEGTRVIVAYKDINKDSSRWFGDEKEKIGSNEYIVADNVTGIFRDYSSEVTNALLIDIIILFLFNFSEFMIVLEQRKKAKDV